MKPTYHTTDAEGETLVTPSVAKLRRVLATLEDADLADFPDVSLVHESGWAVTIDDRWVAVLERVEAPDAPMRTTALGGLEDALALWQDLAAGDLAAVESLPWREVG